MKNKLKTITNKIREHINLIVHYNDVKKLRLLKHKYKGNAIFLLGNGPSLNNLDLTKIFNNSIEYATVNLGHRIIQKTPSNYHFVSDPQVFDRFVMEYEKCNTNMLVVRSDFNTVRKKNTSFKTYFIPYISGGLRKRTYNEDITRGIGNDTSVLLFAAQVLIYLGYTNIYIIGCDLDYSGAKYAYKLNDDDLKFDDNPSIKVKQLKIHYTNDDFKILAESTKKLGVKLYNAGINGNLDSIERRDYDSCISDCLKFRSSGSR